MKVILGIHGLDNKPEKRLLEEWWIKSLNEGLQRIGKDCQLPTFELIYWADIIYDKPLNPEVPDNKDPYFLDEVYTKAPSAIPVSGTHLFISKILPSIIKKFKHYLIDNDLSLKNTNIIDPLIKKYFYEVDVYFTRDNNDSRREKIRKRVIDTIEKYKNDEIFLIGHSMGSIIAYDILYTEASKYSIDTLATIGSPLGFPYIIGKLAEALNITQSEGNKLVVPTSIKKRWYNFYDSTDIIAVGHNLTDEYMPNSKGICPIDIQVINDYMMRGQRNPHNAFGYLRAREFSKLLADFIEKEEQKANLFNKTVDNLKSFLVKSRN
jgi:hypothetical protein